MQVMIRWNAWQRVPMERLLVASCVFIIVPLDILWIRLLKVVSKQLVALMAPMLTIKRGLVLWLAVILGIELPKLALTFVKLHIMLIQLLDFVKAVVALDIILT